MEEVLANTIMAVLGMALVGFFVVAWRSPYTQVRIRRNNDKTLGIAELDQDTTNMKAKIIHTTDPFVIFDKNAQGERRYLVYPDKFKMTDGIPVIRFHHESAEPAVLRPQDVVEHHFYRPEKVKTRVPTGERIRNRETGQVEDKYEEKEEVKLVEFDRKRQVYERMSTPQKLSSLLIQLEGWAETWATQLGMKWLDQMKNLFFLVAIVAVLGLLASGYAGIQVNDVKTVQAQDHMMLQQLYNMTVDVKNDTSRIPVPLKGIGGG